MCARICCSINPVPNRGHSWSVTRAAPSDVKRSARGLQSVSPRLGSTKRGTFRPRIERAPVTRPRPSASLLRGDGENNHYSLVLRKRKKIRGVVRSQKRYTSVLFSPYANLTRINSSSSPPSAACTVCCLSVSPHLPRFCAVFPKSYCSFARAHDSDCF